MIAGNWPSDEWFEPGSEGYLHALGVMSMRYNLLENALHRLIEIYLWSLPESVRDQILLPLNNNQRSNLLHTITKEMEPLETIRDRLNHFRRGFSICAENRNIALHSSGHVGETHFHFIKNRPKAPFEHNIYSTSLSDLRVICDDILNTQDFGWRIIRFVKSQVRKGVNWRYWDEFEMVGNYREFSGPFPLPDKPKLPHKMMPPHPGNSHPDAPILF
ncbi:TPA: hypothetical protein IHM15_004473 [Escherichia coli]|nr:hypothetical protein [Escherichia coli]